MREINMSYTYDLSPVHSGIHGGSATVRPKTEVHLLPDIGHCAVLGGVSKLPEVIDLVTQWLPKQISLAGR
jgi:hypothetical protein